MTRERDRIQENANKYVIRNCPCYTSKGGYYDCWANQDTWCENVTDCLIKQVIDKCKQTLALMNSTSGNNAYAGGRCIEAEQILQLFDIEEINK